MESPVEIQLELYPNGGPPLLYKGDEGGLPPPRKRRKPGSQMMPPETWETLTSLQRQIHSVSSLDFGKLPGDFDPDLSYRALAAYSLLRTLSVQLRLSPFSPNVFLRALYLPYPNQLLGDIHVALLRILLPSLGQGYTFRSSSTAKPISKRRTIDNLRLPLLAGDNLTMLDGLSWPLFCDDYCHLTADRMWESLKDEESHIADYRYILNSQEEDYHDEQFVEEEARKQQLNLQQPQYSYIPPPQAPIPPQLPPVQATSAPSSDARPPTPVVGNLTRSRKNSEVSDVSQDIPDEEGQKRGRRAARKRKLQQRKLFHLKEQEKDTPTFTHKPKISSTLEETSRLTSKVVDIEDPSTPLKPSPNIMIASGKPPSFASTATPIAETNVLDVEETSTFQQQEQQKTPRPKISSSVKRKKRKTLPLHSKRGPLKQPPNVLLQVQQTPMFQELLQFQQMEATRMQLQQYQHEQQIYQQQYQMYQEQQLMQQQCRVPPVLVGETSLKIDDGDAKALRTFIYGIPNPNQESLSLQESASFNKNNNEHSFNDDNSYLKQEHFKHFATLKVMRSGVPYHRLTLANKVILLEFLLDELLQLDIIAAEFARRKTILDCYPVSFGSWPTAQELKDLQNEDECAVCGLEGDLLCCDGCIGSYHKECIQQKGEPPNGLWLCPECQLPDPAKFGPLRAGCKAVLDWCCPVDIQNNQHQPIPIQISPQVAMATTSDSTLSIEKQPSQVNSMVVTSTIVATTGTATTNTTISTELQTPQVQSIVAVPTVVAPTVTATTNTVIFTEKQPSPVQSLVAVSTVVAPAVISTINSAEKEPPQVQSMVAASTVVAPTVEDKTVVVSTVQDISMEEVSNNPVDDKKDAMVATSTLSAPTVKDTTAVVPVDKDISMKEMSIDPVDDKKDATSSSSIATQENPLTSTPSAIMGSAPVTATVQNISKRTLPLEGHEFLLVHGFMFWRKKGDPSISTAPYRLLAKAKIQEILQNLDPSFRLAWPFLQIPNSPTYYSASEAYHPSFYFNRYQRAPLPFYVKAGSGTQLPVLMKASYQHICHTMYPPSYHHNRLTQILTKDMAMDHHIARSLKSQLFLFDPYEIIRGYMVKLDTTLRKACLLDSVWECSVTPRQSVHDIWLASLRNCQSLPRLAKLLVKLVDHVHRRAFLEGWFHNPLLKFENDGSTNYEELPSNWNKARETRKRRWERTPTSQLLGLCEREDCDLQFFVQGIRSDLLDLDHNEAALIIPSKRKKSKTIASSTASTKPACAAAESLAPPTMISNSNSQQEDPTRQVKKAEPSSSAAPSSLPSEFSSRRVNISDIKPPQKPYPAYFQFANKRRLEIKEQNPGVSSIDISKILSNKWKQASDEFKAKFSEEESKQRMEYKNAMEEYHNKIKARYAEMGILYPGKVGATREHSIILNEITDIQGEDGMRRSRRSSRVTRHDLEDSLPIVQAISTVAGARPLLLDENKISDLEIKQYKKRHLKAVEKILKTSQTKESLWPVAGRALFATVGDLSPRDMKRLARNAGSVKAPHIAYHTSHEVGQVCGAYIWRKKTEDCDTYEDLIYQIRILESFLDRQSIHSFEGTARRGKAQFQKEVRCSQRDPETGTVFHFVVNKGRGRGCWMPEEMMDVSTLTLELMTRKQKQIKIRQEKAQAYQKIEREKLAKQRAEKEKVMIAAQQAKAEEMRVKPAAPTQTKETVGTLQMRIIDFSKKVDATLNQHESDVRNLLQTFINIGIVPSEGNMKVLRDKNLAALKVISAGMGACHPSLFLNDQQLIIMMLAKEKTIAGAPLGQYHMTPQATALNNGGRKPPGFVQNKTALVASALMKDPGSSATKVTNFIQQKPQAARTIGSASSHTTYSSTPAGMAQVRNGQRIPMVGGHILNNMRQERNKKDVGGSWIPLSNQQQASLPPKLSSELVDTEELSDLEDWQPTASSSPSPSSKAQNKSNILKNSPHRGPLPPALPLNSFPNPLGSSDQQRLKPSQQERLQMLFHPPNVENSEFPDFQKDQQFSVQRAPIKKFDGPLASRPSVMLQPNQQGMTSRGAEQFNRHTQPPSQQKMGQHQQHYQVPPSHQMTTQQRRHSSLPPPRQMMSQHQQQRQSSVPPPHQMMAQHHQQRQSSVQPPHQMMAQHQQQIQSSLPPSYQMMAQHQHQGQSPLPPSHQRLAQHQQQGQSPLPPSQQMTTHHQQQRRSSVPPPHQMMAQQQWQSSVPPSHQMTAQLQHQHHSSVPPPRQMLAQHQQQRQSSVPHTRQMMAQHQQQRQSSVPSPSQMMSNHQQQRQSSVPPHHQMMAQHQKQQQSSVPALHQMMAQHQQQQHLQHQQPSHKQHVLNQEVPMYSTQNPNKYSDNPQERQVQQQQQQTAASQNYYQEMQQQNQAMQQKLQEIKLLQGWNSQR